MSIFKTTARMFGIVAFALFATPAARAETASISVPGQLSLAIPDAQRPTMPADTSLYSRIAGALSGDPAQPHLGSAISLAGSGPQSSIASLRVYIYSLSQRAHDKLQVRVQFWGNFDAGTSPVFTAPAALGTVDIDLSGPFNLNSQTAYAVDATLPKAAWLDGHDNVGISVQVLSSANGAPFQEQSDELVPASTADAATAGINIKDYADSARDDLNFASNQAMIGKGLAIALAGSSLRLAQCSSWNGKYADRFIEEFNSQAAFDLHWNVAVLDHAVYDGPNGSLTLRTVGSSQHFPYVSNKSETAPIPPSGEFSVRWQAKFLSTANQGAGSLVVSRGLRTYGASPDWTNEVAWAWQNTGQQFHIKAKTNTSVGDPAPVYQESAGTGTVMHDIEYCWLNASIEVWLDGNKVYEAARDSSVPRPDSLWMGHYATISPAAAWSNVEIFRVHVRMPASDVIFSDGFDGDSR